MPERPNPENSPYICWIDLETTGSSDDALIIEIGAVMSDRDLNELSSKQIVLHIGKEWTDQLDPFVLNMHTKNGLLEECYKSDVYLSDADTEMTKWIRGYTSGDHIPLGGSGVSHFDRKFIRRDLRKFDKFLTYWAYDVGSLRRQLRLFGFEVPDRKAVAESRSHRALDDIRDHVAETRQYRDMLRGLLSQGNEAQKRIYESIHQAGRELLADIAKLDSTGTPI